jgi:hypothetical protein
MLKAKCALSNTDRSANGPKGAWELMTPSPEFLVSVTDISVTYIEGCLFGGGSLRRFIGTVGKRGTPIFD